ncbi:MAG: NTP transferase domain-containing protein [Phormidesmis sp.]
MPICCSQRDCQNPRRDFAIVLAAGFSTRMGVCKTTLPWQGGQTLLRYQTEQFLQANITPIVVLGAHNAHRKEDCAVGSQVVIKRGDSAQQRLRQHSKTHTFLTGLAQLPEDAATITLSAIDQPRSVSVYRQLLQAYRQKKALITAPCYQGKLGHPIMFSYQLLDELAAVSDESLGVRSLVRSRYEEIEKVDWATPDILIDINDQVTYQQQMVNLRRQTEFFKPTHASSLYDSSRIYG